MDGKGVEKPQIERDGAMDRRSGGGAMGGVEGEGGRWVQRSRG